MQQVINLISPITHSLLLSPHWLLAWSSLLHMPEVDAIKEGLHYLDRSAVLFP